MLFTACSHPYQVNEFSNPAGPNSMFPRLYTDNTNTLFMNWYEIRNDTTFLTYSQLNVDGWSEAKLISYSQSWFVNWADFASMIARNGSPIAAHWLSKSPVGRYSYDVTLLSLINDTMPPVLAHNDGTATEHGFVSMIPTSDSTFYTIWLDGRFTTISSGHESHSGFSSAMSIRGASFNYQLEKLSETEIDHTTCDCCNTSIAATSNGLIAAYRNRTKDEIRDIYVSRFENNRWSEPTPVYNDNWKINACPVNGPMVSALNKEVALVWFTEMKDQPTIKLAFSGDEGINFDPPIILDTGRQVVGRVDVAITEPGSAWVSWMQHSQADKGSIVIRKVSNTGKTLWQTEVKEVNISRASGFPQLSVSRTGLVLAWTDLSDEHPVVKTAVIQ